ncbi:MAG: DUF2520 domain-containing protein, partial [Acidimicrobiales bacterium]
GPRRALTGPAARGDWQTLERHLEAIDESERPGYRAGVGLALALGAGGRAPEEETVPVPARDATLDTRPAPAPVRS